MFRVEVDTQEPPSVVKSPLDGQEIYLDWEQTLDDRGHLRRCPACGCRELFVRKDFPQVTGFVIVVLAAVIALVLWGFHQLLWGLAVLALVAVLDAVIFLFTPRCLVCYQCRSEFRRLPIPARHPGWELAVGEKYRLSDNPLEARKP